ncbi:metallophosphoesterase family protein [Roseivivax sp. CAU 1761]
MTARIAHISDLHFGRDRPELVDPLVTFLNRSGAELVLISGDLTQRARHHQFRAARAFIDRLSAPVLTVPGNHDTPLDNLWVRALRPWARYRRHVARELEPFHEAEDYVVACLNTADPQAWQRGRLRTRSLHRVTARLHAAEARGKLGIVMMHHPPEHMASDAKKPMRGADRGIQRLSDLGADLVLCGHLHVWRAMPFRAAAGLLLLQAGTGLSTRVRGEPNDLNLIDVERGAVTVTRYGADARAEAFTTVSRTRFRKRGTAWEIGR